MINADFTNREQLLELQYFNSDHIYLHICVIFMLVCTGYVDLWFWKVWCVYFQMWFLEWVVFNDIGGRFSLLYGTSKANFESFANIAYALVTFSIFMSSRFLCKEKPVKPMVQGGCHLLVSIVVYAISQALE